MAVSTNWLKNLKAFVEEWKAKQGQRQYLGDAPFPQFVFTESVDSWGEFIAWTKELKGNWCFRGQREASWSLSTSLDRAAKVDFSTEHGGGYYHLDRDQLTTQKMEEFRRNPPDPKNMPPEEDIGSCYALMQHYGLPTRFLDWTESPFIAAYFAFEHEPREGAKRSALWALDLDWLDDSGRQLLPAAALGALASADEVRARLEEKLMGESHSVIIRAHPRQLNQRMIAQQGVLLCKLFHQAYFSSILMTMMMHPETPDRLVIRKLEIPGGHRTEFLTRLAGMGIDTPSLFPDENPPR